MTEELKATTKAVSKKDRILDFLEWSVKVAEHLLVLAITAGVFWIVLRLLWKPDEQRAILKMDWRIFAVMILVPLFYRPVRDFIDEIVEIWKIKRQKGTTTEEEEVKLKRKHIVETEADE